MKNLFLILFYNISLTLSVYGYGSLFKKNFLNNEINKYDFLNLVSIQGFFGLIFLTFLSYSTSIFFKHGYLHNILIHLVGLFFFYKNLKFFFKKILILLSIFFLGSIVLKSHDDFFYYHFTYSLTLVQEKLQFGLGNLGHGYKQHSPIFVFNSILYLPFIKYYLFNFFNFFILINLNLFLYQIFKEKIFFKKRIKNFITIFFSLSSFLYINIKFYRLSEYGTDLSGQLLFLVIFLILIFISKFEKIKTKNNFLLILIFLVFLGSIKTYFIPYSFFLLTYLCCIYYKKINWDYFYKSKLVIIFLFFYLFFYFIFQFAYTGCLIYPLKQTCFTKNIFWALDEKTIEYLSKWYSVWAKSIKTYSFEQISNSKFYDFSWIHNWIKDYFLKRGAQNLLYIILTPLVIFFYFFSIRELKINKVFTDKINFLLLILVIIFFEWFVNHPALRYGGYTLILAIIFLIYFIIINSNFNIFFRENFNKRIFILIIATLLIFNGRNLYRIFIVEKNFSNNFPLYYYENCMYEKIKKNKNINIYVPQKCILACSIDKTPCAGANNELLKTKRFLDYNFYFYSK